ncbi:hypothetical protein GCM10010441_44900 [Kitasatospora paracochleata]|uniref:Uncharacterized protein n=1 Tax=Kitasatospora paracochleata TaxID=58354 RepID=A0ABT1J9D4_9ACTN|nr:hypothetical protein [Kitasatospora paracochleata]MCP2314067.1 hypothetical protein [Kitasatospora paracochleata]
MTQPGIDQTPRAELYRALVTGETLVRQPSQDHREVASVLLDAYRDQVRAEAADVTEALRIRLWLIEQALQPIDVQNDPAGIVGIVGPYLNGPIHPTFIAAYRAARGAHEQESSQ